MPGKAGNLVTDAWKRPGSKANVIPYCDGGNTVNSNDFIHVPFVLCGNYIFVKYCIAGNKTSRILRYLRLVLLIMCSLLTKTGAALCIDFYE